ncbi:hypothetical protein DMB66_25140 [Actinoplanes sp. ATCC 53533]|uniref:hypothetical protein n=1 Tax=Actinoplanes sp. ATCC 53533 TaxID=1288362 RepID=UPI000F7A470D|nr:hypothetical protein [Actinoplanes sp. ATCC 53533]RSM60237.1 hypothetical protein DMB66_25140 [Actinoplanes sp. ATCC 53533]
MQQRLREIGAWLAVNGEAIYDTTYRANGAADGNLRFTIRPNEAFYLHSLTPPGSTVSSGMPVPIRDTDQITVLGYQGRPPRWTRNPTDGITIDVPTAAHDAGNQLWTCKASKRR